MLHKPKKTGKTKQTNEKELHRQRQSPHLDPNLMPQIVAAGVRQQQQHQQQVLFTFISEVSRYTLVVDREVRKGGGRCLAIATKATSHSTGLSIGDNV